MMTAESYGVATRALCANELLNCAQLPLVFVPSLYNNHHNQHQLEIEDLMEQLHNQLPHHLRLIKHCMRIETFCYSTSTNNLSRLVQSFDPSENLVNPTTTTTSFLSWPHLKFLHCSGVSIPKCIEERTFEGEPPPIVRAWLAPLRMDVD